MPVAPGQSEGKEGGRGGSHSCMCTPPGASTRAAAVSAAQPSSLRADMQGCCLLSQLLEDSRRSRVTPSSRKVTCNDNSPAARNPCQPPGQAPTAPQNQQTLLSDCGTQISCPNAAVPVLLEMPMTQPWGDRHHAGLTSNHSSPEQMKS